MGGGADDRFIFGNNGFSHRSHRPYRPHSSLILTSMEGVAHPLLFAKGFARALGDWLLREPGARSVIPFPSARRGGLQVLPSQREDLGGILSMGVSPPLRQRGLQGPWGLATSLRSVTPFPLRSPRGPLQTNNKDVAWLFQSLLFLFVSLLLCKPEYAYKQKKGFSQS